MEQTIRELERLLDKYTAKVGLYVSEACEALARQVYLHAIAGVVVGVGLVILAVIGFRVSLRLYRSACNEYRGGDWCYDPKGLGAICLWIASPIMLAIGIPNLIIGILKLYNPVFYTLSLAGKLLK